MQKILIIILAILGSGLVLFGQTQYTFAAESAMSTEAKPVKIFTSEKVPGANCICVRGTSAAGATEYDATDLACRGEVTARKYECTVPSGLSGFQSVFKQLMRYIVNIVLLLGVLAVVGLGIAWSFAGGDDIKAKTTLKTWGMNILVGFVILFFFSSILYFLAPWVYQ